MKRTVNSVEKVISLAIWVETGKGKVSLAYSGKTGILQIELEPTIIVPTHLTIKSLVYFLNIPLKQLSANIFIL